MIGANTDLSGAELRKFRAQMAQSLLDSMDETDCNVALTFTTIDALPRWLLLSKQEADQIANLLGSVWFLPTLQHCLAGSVLRPISKKIGEDDFNWLLELEITTGDQPPAARLNLPEAIDQTGKTILLSLIDDDNLRCLIAKRFGETSYPVGEIETDRAQSVVQIVEERLRIAKIAQKEDAA